MYLSTFKELKSVNANNHSKFRKKVLSPFQNFMPDIWASQALVPYVHPGDKSKYDMLKNPATRNDMYINVPVDDEEQCPGHHDHDVHGQQENPC